MSMVYGLPEKFWRDLTKWGSSTRQSQLAFVNVNDQRIFYGVLLFSGTIAVYYKHDVRAAHTLSGASQQLSHRTTV